MQKFNYNIEKIELSDSTFSLLPNLIKQFVYLQDSKHKKSLALFSAMTVISGILPNYQFTFFDKKFDPNLFGFVYGKFGSGKGQMRAAMDLLNGIKLYIHKKNGLPLDINPGVEEKNISVDKRHRKMLRIPANTSKSNIYELLRENNERGIIYEAEADTLINAIKSNTGNFTDILRNTFDNEGISNSFKVEHSFVEIERPVLSILISGTENQLLNLFSNREDGFMSRFFLFELEPPTEIVTPKNEYRVNSLIKKKISEKLLKLYTNLERLEAPILFEFSKEQTGLLTNRFNEYLEDFKEAYNGELNGLVTRYYFLIRRVAMIFSILEADFNNLPKKIICNENTLKLSRRLMRFFFNEFEIAFNRHEKIDTSKIEANIDAKEQRLNQIKQAKMLKEYYGIGPSEISIRIFGDDSHKGTVSKWLRLR